MVAAVTLGHVDEHPFVREGRRPARIVLTDPDDAARPFDLEVEVDRGDTTYVQPLPEASVPEFLNDPYKGWGQEQNTQSSPSYVDISAIPSAKVVVSQSGEKVGEVRWGGRAGERSREGATSSGGAYRPGKELGPRHRAG